MLLFRLHVRWFHDAKISVKYTFNHIQTIWKWSLVTSFRQFRCDDGRWETGHSNVTHQWTRCIYFLHTLIARFMGPTWGPSGADRTQVGPMLAPWTLPSGYLFQICLTTNIIYEQTWIYRYPLMCAWSCIVTVSVKKALPNSWWRHQMETFSALLANCAENSPEASNAGLWINGWEKIVRLVIWNAIGPIMTSL